MSLIKREHRPWPAETTLGSFWTDDRVDRMFRDMFGDFFGVHATPMRIEEYLDGDTGVIRAELPGLDPDSDVEITIADGLLHIRAERQERKREELPDGYRSEFRYGHFERSVRLPEGVTESDIKAKYADGILEVRVPKAAAPAATPAARIPVTHG